MAHRRKKKTVRMGDAEYGLYNFNFPKSLEHKSVQPTPMPIVEGDNVTDTAKYTSDLKKRVTLKTEFLDEDGNVVDVVVEELKQEEEAKQEAPVFEAQEVKAVEEKHIKMSFLEMRELTARHR